MVVNLQFFGGRGGSSGLSSHSGKTMNKPSYFKETEKAVQLKLTVEDYTTEDVISKLVYVPKSQLSEDGKPGEWITRQKVGEFYDRQFVPDHKATWSDASGKEFSPSMTKKEVENAKKRGAAFKSGQNSYNELVAEAKRLGVKGARVGMKRTTLQKKIAEAKNRK